MRLAVTGVSGKIGRLIINNLLKKNEVICFSKSKKLNLKKVKIFQHDFVKSSLKNKINRKYDTILHLANQNNQNIKDKYDNKKIILNLIDSFQRISKFIFLSSQMVYGNPNKINVKESFYLQPRSSYYANSKISCENLLSKISKKHKIAVINLRISGILNSKESLMSKIKEDMKKNKNIKLYGSKNLYRDYLHTDDLERVIKLIYKKKFEKSKMFIYNFSSFQNKTIYELVSLMKRYLKSKSKILILKKPPIRENFSMNISKIKKELKFRNANLKKMISKFSYEK